MIRSNRILGGRYPIQKRLGAGGYGQTFLAIDAHLPDQPQCVVKQLHPIQTDPESLQIAKRLFDTEAKVLYRLGDHDQIPKLLVHFEQDGEFYLVQDYIPGKPLSFELQPGCCWEPEQVIQFLQEILEILKFVHDHQVIHRDIKPENIMGRYHDRHLVLIDFGAVKQISTFQPLGNTALSHTISIGTQGYTPSEQLSGHPKPCSDLYAVGMIAIFALTGVRPRDLTQDLQTLELQWHHLASIPTELAETLDRMVRYDFRDRFSSAEAVLQHLNTLPRSITADLTASPASPTSGPQDLPPPMTPEPTKTLKLESTQLRATLHPLPLIILGIGAGLLGLGVAVWGFSQWVSDGKPSPQRSLPPSETVQSPVPTATPALSSPLPSDPPTPVASPLPSPVSGSTPPPPLQTPLPPTLAPQTPAPLETPIPALSQTPPSLPFSDPRQIQPQEQLSEQAREAEKRAAEQAREAARQ